MSYLMHIGGSKGDGSGSAAGAPDWLKLIWACNEIEEGFFGQPSHIGEWWAGGTVEEYPDARVIIQEEVARVVSLTEHGTEIIGKALDNLGWKRYTIC